MKTIVGTKWYYYTGTINGGSIVRDEPVGVFKGEVSRDSLGKLWVHKNGGYRNYHDYYDTYEEALAEYTKSVNDIVHMYVKRSAELLAAITKQGF